ncbi:MULTISPECIES: ABC transporter ATP-binding protein [unclassified Arthrobacter]|uniref:ABC transporter ATP-binding protein n=1 Tax=unclassified Arthrobacter TaxID=235627 RepID=UPI0002FF42E0|nr:MULTISPECIES: ABC transporter ATP-binding protein [unclassified Arthrobacter]PVE19647.1 ABC transporter ATP-binding protein [Arthrobacter sp. Bz4]
MSDETLPEGPAVQTRGLSKRFGGQTVLDGIDLSVPRGSVFGFLGPNGSGKTTTIRILLGLASATSGDVEVLGRKIPRFLPEVLPRVGALVEGPGFYPFLSGRANLHRLDAADRFVDPSTRRARTAQALERVGLSQAADKKVGAYSLGMKQRLGIANALLTHRDLIVLDEPTNGLDPQGTREVRHLVHSLTAEGTTVFVSSHLLAEVEQICSHVAVLRAGKLVAQGELSELRAAGQTRVEVLTPDGADCRQVLTRLGLTPQEPTPSHHTPGGSDVAVGAPLPEHFPPETIVAALVAAGVRVKGFTVDQVGLEELFVSLTGEGFDVVQ